MTDLALRAGRHLRSPHLYRRIFALLLLAAILFLFRHLAIFLIFLFLSVRSFGFLGQKVGRFFKIQEKYGVLICLALLLSLLGVGIWVSIRLGWRSFCPPNRISTTQQHVSSSKVPSSAPASFVEQKTSEMLHATYSVFDALPVSVKKSLSETMDSEKKENTQSLLDSFYKLRNELIQKVPSCIPIASIFDGVFPHIKKFLSEKGADYAQTIGKSVGRVLLEILLGFIVAMIYLLERKKVNAFLEDVTQDGVLLNVRKYLGFIGEAIVITVQLQVMVALVNTLLTLPVLLALRLPYLGWLIVVVFVSSLIPILGNLISGAVLVIVSYLHQGFLGVFLFLGITIILHKIEAYYLNPRLSSRHVNLPTVILVFSLICFEHFFGILGVFLSFPSLYVGIKLFHDIKAGMTASLLTNQEVGIFTSAGLEGP